MSVLDALGKAATRLARSPALENLARLPSGSDFMLTGDMHWLGKTAPRLAANGAPAGVPGLTYRLARVFDDPAQAEAYAHPLVDDVMAVTTSPDGRTMVVMKNVDDYGDDGVASMIDAAGNRISGPAQGMESLFNSGGLAGDQGVLGELARTKRPRGRPQ